MDFARFVARLTERPDYRGQMAHVEILPAREARYGAPPVGLHPRLAETLKQIGIERWYAHQSEALAAIGAGHDVVVVTPTASGKSLCYQAPVLDAVLKEPRTRSRTSLASFGLSGSGGRFAVPRSMGIRPRTIGGSSRHLRTSC